MANKIRSIELENGVLVTFFQSGMIELAEGNHLIAIHSTDLESIRDTAKSNARIEASSNGTLIVNKEAAKS